MVCAGMPVEPTLAASRLIVVDPLTLWLAKQPACEGTRLRPHELHSEGWPCMGKDALRSLAVVPSAATPPSTSNARAKKSCARPSPSLLLWGCLWSFCLSMLCSWVFNDEGDGNLRRIAPSVLFHVLTHVFQTTLWFRFTDGAACSMTGWVVWAVVGSLARAGSRAWSIMEGHPDAALSETVASIGERPMQRIALLVFYIVVEAIQAIVPLLWFVPMSAAYRRREENAQLLLEMETRAVKAAASELPYTRTRYGDFDWDLEQPDRQSSRSSSSTSEEEEDIVQRVWGEDPPPHPPSARSVVSAQSVMGKVDAATPSEGEAVPEETVRAWGDDMRGRRTASAADCAPDVVQGQRRVSRTADDLAIVGIDSSAAVGESLADEPPMSHRHRASFSSSQGDASGGVTSERPRRAELVVDTECGPLSLPEIPDLPTAVVRHATPASSDSGPVDRQTSEPVTRARRQSLRERSELLARKVLGQAGSPADITRHSRAATEGTPPQHPSSSSARTHRRNLTSASGSTTGPSTPARVVAARALTTIEQHAELVAIPLSRLEQMDPSTPDNAKVVPFSEPQSHPAPPLSKTLSKPMSFSEKLKAGSAAVDEERLPPAPVWRAWACCGSVVPPSEMRLHRFLSGDTPQYMLRNPCCCIAACPLFILKFCVDMESLACRCRVCRCCAPGISRVVPSIDGGKEVVVSESQMKRVVTATLGQLKSFQAETDSPAAEGDDDSPKLVERRFSPQARVRLAGDACCCCTDCCTSAVCRQSSDGQPPELSPLERACRCCCIRRSALWPPGFMTVIGGLVAVLGPLLAMVRQVFGVNLAVTLGTPLLALLFVGSVLFDVLRREEGRRRLDGGTLLGALLLLEGATGSAGAVFLEVLVQSQGYEYLAVLLAYFALVAALTVVWDKASSAIARKGEDRQAFVFALEVQMAVFTNLTLSLGQNVGNYEYWVSLLIKVLGIILFESNLTGDAVHWFITGRIWWRFGSAREGLLHLARAKRSLLAEQVGISAAFLAIAAEALLVSSPQTGLDAVLSRGSPDEEAVDAAVRALVAAGVAFLIITLFANKVALWIIRWKVARARLRKGGILAMVGGIAAVRRLAIKGAASRDPSLASASAAAGAMAPVAAGRRVDSIHTSDGTEWVRHETESIASAEHRRRLYELSKAPCSHGCVGCLVWCGWRCNRFRKSLFARPERSVFLVRHWKEFVLATSLALTAAIPAAFLTQARIASEASS
jgi:hypothetical protein